METIQTGLAWQMRNNPMGETHKDALRLGFDHEVKREFHGTEVTGGIYAEQHQGLEAFSKIGGEWDDLFRRSDGASPFLARAWTITFVREGRLQGAPLLITVRAGQKLVALLALSVRRAAGTKIAQPIGTTVPSYLGVLLDPQFRRAIYWMADFIAKKSSIGVLSFQNVSSVDQATNELVAELGKRRFVSHSTRRRPCHYIRLGCSFDEYLKTSKSARQRKKLRKEDRKLSRYGHVKLLRYEAAEISPEILSRVAAIQEQSWMKRRGGSVLGQPFYQKLLLETAEAGLGRVWLMTIDGEDAAFKYALISHRRLYLQWTAFKLKYASSLSVGKVLTQATIRDACDNDIVSVDFGHGDAPHKRFWATDSYNVNRVAVGRGLAGRLVVLWLAVRWWLANRKWIRTRYQAFRRQFLKVRNQFASAD